eukprot:5335740-Amphidinium_carterae.1
MKTAHSPIGVGRWHRPDNRGETESPPLLDMVQHRSHAARSHSAPSFGPAYQPQGIRHLAPPQRPQRTQGSPQLKAQRCPVASVRCSLLASKATTRRYVLCLVTVPSDSLTSIASFSSPKVHKWLKYAFASLCQSLPAEWRKHKTVPLALPCNEKVCRASANRFGPRQVACATARPLHVPNHAKQEGKPSSPDRNVTLKMTVQPRNGGISQVISAHRVMIGHFTIFLITNHHRLVLGWLIIRLPLHLWGSDTNTVRVNRLP